MIDNTYYQTMFVAEKSHAEIALSKRDKQPIQWQTPQAQKLSKADLHIHSTYSDGIPTIEQILKHTDLERSIDLIHEQGGLAIVVHPLKPLFSISCQREVLDRIYANKDLWLDGIETWNAGLCGIYANRVTMRANRQFYGWSEVGNSDAHTLNAIGRACTLFQGSTASDVRAAIQSGLSTPGGKIWRVNDFLALASFHFNKRRSARRQPAA